MKAIVFKNNTFYYESSDFNYFLNEDNLTFFHSESEYEVGIHISISNNKLVLRPRYGVTIQKLSRGKYQIISNSK